MCDIHPYKDQIYQTLKSQHDSYNLFVDPKFPAAHASIYHSGKSLDDVQWYRPTVFIQFNEKKKNKCFSFAVYDRRFIEVLNLL